MFLTLSTHILSHFITFVEKNLNNSTAIESLFDKIDQKINIPPLSVWFLEFFRVPNREF